MVKRAWRAYTPTSCAPAGSRSPQVRPEQVCAGEQRSSQVRLGQGRIGEPGHVESDAAQVGVEEPSIPEVRALPVARGHLTRPAALA
ncbi:MAG TPA: hypothetical protein VGP82_18455 [Ktedonobacterales bacterium]|nr:hypothetical protein [Ktedonobacterales bacterium]